VFGYTFGAVVTLVGVILLIGISGTGAAFSAQIALPTQVPTSTLTPTLTFTVTATSAPPTATLTPSLTPTPTLAPTETLTPTPTPVLALVRTRDGQGALIRSEPGGQVIGSYLDNVMIQVLPERFEDNSGVWVKVIGPDGAQGWMLQSLLVTATPAPNW
ncbi:MAG TPA: SH3 domain-containing protein, partial [Anaerolineales bacterium]|nr:SH3 domain-containing protein [Anaerolineales bacterium]